MKNSKTHVTKLVFLAMMVALGVVISPILRVEGMCPMAHFINVTCAVMLGPWYAFVCALAIGIIRMVCMGIPPLALTGAIFGAFLSGMLYRLSKGKLVCAFIGEVIGTGIIGAIIPGLDMISFGPTLRSPHSPDERALIPTVQKFYDFLIATLEQTPMK